MKKRTRNIMGERRFEEKENMKALLSSRRRLFLMKSIGHRRPRKRVASKSQKLWNLDSDHGGRSLINSQSKRTRKIIPHWRLASKRQRTGIGPASIGQKTSQGRGRETGRKISLIQFTGSG